MRIAKRFVVPVVAAGLAMSAWSGTAAQSPAAPAACDLTGTKPVSLQLQWVTQAQFAGYFAAKDNCFYAKHGLDVTFIEADPSGTPPQVVGSDPSGPEFTIAWVPEGPRAARQGPVGPGRHRPGLPALGHPVARLEGQRHHLSARTSRARSSASGRSATSTRSPPPSTAAGHDRGRLRQGRASTSP